MSQILTDELGQSFQISNEDSYSLNGKECLLTNINTVKSIAAFLSTSLGPTGMDKILIDQDEHIIVTNDGATILEKMDMTQNPISGLIMQLSKSQDEEIGDGTTSIVVLASALLQEAKLMIEKGMHPIKIAQGYSQALKLALTNLETIAEPITDLNSIMLKAAKTSLSSKIVCSSNFAEMCVKAVLATADFDKKDLDMELICIKSINGGNLSDTQLIKGIVLEKTFSHVQMPNEIKNAKIALLSCPFELPQMKTKNSLLIKSANEYRELVKYQNEKFQNMIDQLKKSEADAVLCQWGFDDEANSLLLQNNIPAIRWVGGHELGLIAVHTFGRIVAFFEDLNKNALGLANLTKMSFGTESHNIIIIENPEQKKSVTILVRGSTKYVIEEAKRSIHDALCSIRNVLISNGIVYGGGSAEISTSIYLEKASTNYSSEIEEAIKRFSKALLEIPLTLAQNSGFEPISYVEKLRELQLNTGEHALGVDCLEMGDKNMRKLEIFESLKSKVRQFEMATELVCMILKINDVILISSRNN